MEELTVFIKVKIANLKASSIETLEIVKKEVRINKDSIKISTDKKYL